MWALLQQADVLMGVHGAGLTQSVFMRPKTILIQVMCAYSVLLLRICRVR